VVADLKIVEAADSKTALMTYNRARQEERPVQDNRAKAQTEKLMEDKAGKTAN